MPEPSYRTDAQDERPRGTCVVCGQDRPVRLDGTIYLHRTKTGHGCDGSHQPPYCSDNRCPLCSGTLA